MTDQKTKPQRDRFVEKAREMECDEDEDRFNKTLKRIAPKKDEAPASLYRLRLSLKGGSSRSS